MIGEIDWSKQHCGVHQAPITEVVKLMPDIAKSNILATFPDDVWNFTWDIKVHMLMPRQYPCIPNWHVDNIPRVNGMQRFDLAKPDLPMYCWISGAPLTQFETGYLEPKKWHRFTQKDSHRGTMASEFCWRAFIRATHTDIQKPKAGDWLRRHCQVYIDSAETYKW